MITEADLRRLLTTAAESFEPPADGAKRILEHPSLRARHVSHGSRRWLPTLQVLRWTGAAVLVVGVLALLGFAVTHSRSSSTGASSKSSGGTVSGPSVPAAAGAYGKHAPTLPQAAAAGSGSGSSAGGATGPAPASAPAASSVPGTPNRVIQTGQVSLEVPRGRVTSALDRLSAIAAGVGGYLSDSRSDSGAESPNGTSTLRVPVADFSSVLVQVRRIGHVTSLSSQAQDVTSQYVDLGARITALEQERATFLTLLSKATTIGDTLAVQQQIQPVQTQIEQLQGQQKLLADRSDLATLAVTVSEVNATVVAPPVKHHPGGFVKAWHSAVHGFNRGLQGLISIAGGLLLAIIVLAFLAVIGRQGYRLIRRWQA